MIEETYGAGDGRTTFELPDLRGRVALGEGTGDAGDATAHALADKEGAETHTLLTAEMPSHDHELTSGAATNAGLGADIGKAGAPSGTKTETSGSDGAHANLQPSLCLNFIIRAWNHVA